MIKEVNRTLMKIVRALATYHGCLVAVALKGAGISHLIKLSCFNEGLFLKYLQLSNESPETVRSLYLADLRELITAAGQEDRPVVFAFDPQDLTQQANFRDEEVVLEGPTSQALASVTAMFSDIRSILRNQMHHELFLT